MTAMPQPSGRAHPAAGGETGAHLCPFCAEAVRPAAKSCPHCQSRLVRFAVLRSELTWAIPVLLGVALICTAGAWLEQRFSDQGRPFAPHQQELVVRAVRLSEPGARQRAVVTGMVTNQGRYPWRVRTLEVRFLNPDGSWLDVHHPAPADPFVVQPGQEAAFAVTLDSALPETVRRAPLEVRVQHATDGTRAARP